MIRILFTGVAGTGKDTTMCALMMKLKMSGRSLDYAPEVAHLALYSGFQLDKETGIGSQLYMFGEQL